MHRASVHINGINGVVYFASPLTSLASRKNGERRHENDVRSIFSIAATAWYNKITQRRAARNGIRAASRMAAPLRAAALRRRTYRWHLAGGRRRGAAQPSIITGRSVVFTPAGGSWQKHAIPAGLMFTRKQARSARRRQR